MFGLFREKGLFKAPDGSRFSPARPADPADIDLVEEELGFGLPNLLKKLYVDLGNGGFGPGYGVIGLSGGHTDRGHDLVSLYKELREDDSGDPTYQWPAGVVPICHHGCGLYSCVHCLEDNMPVYWWTCDEFSDDGESVPKIGDNFRLDKPSFEEWVKTWKL